MKPNRDVTGIPVIVTIALLGVVVLVALGIWADRAMRSAVIDQFNAQQMILADVACKSIKEKFERLIQQLASFAKSETQDTHFDLKSWGVKSIRIMDCGIGKLFKKSEDYPELDKEILEKSCKLHEPTWFDTDNDNVQKPLGLLVVPTKENSQVLTFVDIYLFLKPILQEISSGKTGYAWLIDQHGRFVYHPMDAFVGQNAFVIREKVAPGLPYKSIYHIQNAMIRGERGMGRYWSAWHRDWVGPVEKLIAYTPVKPASPQGVFWSLAVVAPIWEVEGAVRSVGRKLFAFYAFVFLLLVGGGIFITYRERKWADNLEKLVEERTRELRQSEDRYRSLVESAEDFIFTVTQDGMIGSINSFMARFFGISPSDANNKPVYSLFPPDAASRLMEMVDYTLTNGRSCRKEIEVALKPTENPMFLSVTICPFGFEAHHQSVALCIARDLTEYRKLERQLINAEKLASLGTLAAGVAHEINNPLGVILGFCDLLKEKFPPGSEEYEDLLIIEKQGSLCKGVVENLLSFARKKGAENGGVDVNACIIELLRLVGHSLELDNIQVVTDLRENLPPIDADQGELQQVFLNLITNARAAMKKGGTLSIRTFSDHSKAQVIVEVADTGEGIPEEHMDRIFEPFFTTKPEGEGTGLGLFVTYGIVTKYGGAITCESPINRSEAGKGGTLFRITLPAVIQKEES
ncbi:MAG: PAS domain S-box protein [Deltaproteobacteria bacterium]|nr:PAS domain S-box protein [Deltaproteobacteria bacterium]MBW2067625.1 PAS domain S-box protein [Deltaproteobacteria bacterium]